MKATIWNYRFYIDETDPDKVLSFFNDSLKKAEFMVVNFNEHHFYPHGYTALWLLAESHFAVHTFPEENTAYCELSSCNPSKYKIFVQLMNDKGVTVVE